ncbi:MAG: thiamine pyrophosphate-dependent enzyme [Candidatus Marsarchaeota archaeon]|nr:thiamine pyrophosphate-dependent enzyme [Candidatus Marsarchaeota archaeon]
MLTQQNYKSDIKPIFCPGCGDYGVDSAILKAMTDLQLDPDNTVVVSGIGCSSSMPHDLKTYGIHGIHGRALPIAEGVKLSNESLTVLVAGGDGDGYGIGMGHFVHAIRRNIDITYIVMNNEIYGLTTGQASPTSMMGQKTKSTPFGVIERPVNPIAVALAAGATYVARGFSGDPMHLAKLIEGGIKHKGFALIDVQSPCVSFNHFNTYDWFRPRVYKLEEQGHDPHDFNAAMQKAFEFDNDSSKFPIGLFYEADKPIYAALDVALKKGPLVSQPMPTKEEIAEVMSEHMLD